jgi:hypothetical protein
MTTGKEARSKVEETTGNRRTTRRRRTRKSKREMRTGRRHLPRKEKLTRKRSRDAPGIGASTTWHGAITRKSSADSTNQQTNGLNQVAAQAALATVLNPEWQALMANMARNMVND